MMSSPLLVRSWLSMPNPVRYAHGRHFLTGFRRPRPASRSRGAHLEHDPPSGSGGRRRRGTGGSDLGGLGQSPVPRGLRGLPIQQPDPPDRHRTKSEKPDSRDHRRRTRLNLPVRYPRLAATRRGARRLEPYRPIPLRRSWIGKSLITLYRLQQPLILQWFTIIPPAPTPPPSQLLPPHQTLCPRNIPRPSRSCLSSLKPPQNRRLRKNRGFHLASGKNPVLFGLVGFINE